MGIARSPFAVGAIMTAMSDDERRQDDATPADLSRQVLTGDDSECSLTVEEALARYEAAGLPRTPRSIQRYCTKGYLEARRIETEFGEKFLIKPESVDRHIAYIIEVRPVTTGRDLSRHVATEGETEIKDESMIFASATTDDKVRQVPTTPEMSRPVAAADDRYVAMLGSVENHRELMTAATRWIIAWKL